MSDIKKPRITVTYLPRDIGIIINDEYEKCSIDLSIPEIKRVVKNALLIPDVLKEIKEYIELIDYN